MKLKLIILISILNTLFLNPSLASERGDKINNFIQGFYNIKQFNGNVLVSQNGKVIFEKSFGYANFEWNIKNTPETKFRIGSVTKQFTSMLIMQLVQEKRIELHKPINYYLKDYRTDTGKRVTVHQLLNHTSGIPDYLRIRGFRKNYSRSFFTVDEFIEKFCSGDLEFEPGTKFRYSNSGYTILGKIIEEVTKKKYQEVLAEKILKPLGMKNTGYDSTSTILMNRANGYENNLDGYTNTDYLDMSIPYAAGSMYSTAQDLMIWDTALYENKLLTISLTKKMHEISSHRNYAYGWEVNQLSQETYGKPLTINTHGGGINGFNASITRIIDDRYLIVLLNNTGGAPISYLNKGITDILYGKIPKKAEKRLDQVLYSEIKLNGISAALKKYTELKKSGEKITERNLNSFGYELAGINLVEEAIEIFKLNAENFPNSSNAYDSLAEAYLLNGQHKSALVNYKKSLALDESNMSAQEAIKRLEHNLVNKKLTN